MDVVLWMAVGLGAGWAAGKLTLSSGDRLASAVVAGLIGAVLGGFAMSQFGFAALGGRVSRAASAIPVRILSFMNVISSVRDDYQCPSGRVGVWLTEFARRRGAEPRAPLPGDVCSANLLASRTDTVHGYRLVNPVG
jgi:uncharacterized membrane protein YeaQ/YmgE (transglycosylase-associated protein family)